MLPGLDLGDTPSFQTMAASPFISPRDGYPLYFAFAAPLVWLAGDLAHGMNLASVVAAALACGVVVLVSYELSRAVLPSVVAAIVFAGSYTFWSQAVTAEVYALHMLCLGTVWLALLAWERQPTHWRLTRFLAVYALGFGNHLTMVLLLPGLVLFLAVASPEGGRLLRRPRVVLTAVACAAAGAAQYLWNVRTMLLAPDAPRQVADALRLFWFDVTKADWRETMVLELPTSMLTARAQMFAFDVGQQFGWLLPLCLAGAAALALRSPRRFALLTTCYAVATAFALTYSVGDTHVFLLPAHLIMALCAAPGLSWLMHAAGRRIPAAAPMVGGLGLIAALVHVYDEYPALDRSTDHRAQQTLDALTGDLRDHRALFLGDLEWQLQNGLHYYAAHARDDLAVTAMASVLPYAPVLIRDNQRSGREVVVSDRARQLLASAYGPLYEVVEDPRVAVPSLASRVEAIAPGTRYVFCLIRPVPEQTLDRADVEAGLARLTGQALRTLPAGAFVAIAGIAGAPPALVRHADRPFRAATTLDGLPVDVRIESWLPFDTIRRMGFGHVIAGRTHALIIERGVSVVALDASGRPSRTAYAAGLYAPQPRYRVVPPPS